MRIRIYYHHTDCGGVVYYANYLNFLEEARTEYFALKNASIKQLADSGTMFVVARQEIDYKAPAFYGDCLNIGAKISGVSAVKIEYDHEVKNQSGQVICLARTTLVCVDNNIKPRPIPEDISRKLSV